MRTELEAMERFVAAAEAGRVVRMSARERAELEAVEWGETEKALRKQKEFPGLRERMRRWVLSIWWPTGMGDEKRS